MLKPFFAILLVLLASAAHAQQPGYLVLIDAEDGRSFQARIGDTVIQSSDLGHLLISHLKDSTYSVSIQFPRQAILEQQFRIKINKRDLGYQLRKTDNNKWALYNWQTHDTKIGIELPDSLRYGPRGTRRVDAFSSLMAAVVNDSSVLYNTYTGAGFSKDSIKKPVIVSKGMVVKTAVDTAAKKALVLKSDSAKAVAIKNKKGKTAGVSIAYPYIKKLRERSLTISRKLIYVDVKDSLTMDTITLFIFFEKKRPDTIAKKPQAVALKKIPVDTVLKKPVVDTIVKIKKDTVKAVPENHCEPAAEKDVEALRDMILIKNTESDKVGEAVKSFRLKCFTVQQIRILAALFATDHGKYKLLEAASHHVSDSAQFSTLSDMITDKTLLKKLKALK